MLASIIADIRALQASWSTVRGGWGAARSDARQLLAHRRIMVETDGVTGAGTQTVLRTRVRLSGDTQTEILRGWIISAPPDAVAATAGAHFESVAAAMGGFAAALGMERLAARLVMLAGTLASVMATVNRLWREAPGLWLHTMAAHWWLLSGLALALLAVVVRRLLRWRLQALFRRGLGGQAGT